jgi:hypothetical protein
LLREIFADAVALTLQKGLRLIQIVRRTSPCPIDVIVANRDQNQIRKPPEREQLGHLPGKISRAENPAKKFCGSRSRSTSAPTRRVLRGDERREFLQSFRYAANAGRLRIDIKKPISAPASMRSPECTPNGRDVDAHADAIAEHGNMREACNQFSLRNLTFSVGQVIWIERRRRFDDSL